MSGQSAININYSRFTSLNLRINSIDKFKAYEKVLNGNPAQNILNCSELEIVYYTTTPAGCFTLTIFSEGTLIQIEFEYNKIIF